MELVLLQILVVAAEDVEGVAAEVAEGMVAENFVFFQNLFHNPPDTNFFALVVL